ncbi:hypothetical protein OB920_18250 [Halobacteria archaeon HArc-gm2]|nr:hypothetical protein [Halobacteria archaeon HArc-gm2]
MRRRKFLATTAALLAVPFSGCSDPSGRLSLENVDDDETLARRYAQTDDQLDDDEQRILDDAVAGDEPELNGTSPHFEEGSYDQRAPVAHDGSYYNVSHEVVETYQYARHGIGLDLNPPEDFSPSEGAIAVEDLPPVDRDVVAEFFPVSEDHRETDGADVFHMGTYSPAEEAESVLVPDPEYDAVTRDGTTYPVEIDDGGPVEITRYRYETTQVAASHAEMAARVRDRYLFTLEGLPEDEREIMREAAKNGRYVTEETPGQAFVDLLDRFRPHRPLEGDGEDYGTWLVAFDGTVYLADVTAPLNTPASESG